MSMLGVHTMALLPTGVPVARESLLNFLGQEYQQAPFTAPAGLIERLLAVEAAFSLEKSTGKEGRL